MPNKVKFQPDYTPNSHIANPFTDLSYTVRHGIKLQVHLEPSNLWSGVQEIIIFGYYTIDIS